MVVKGRWRLIQKRRSRRKNQGESTKQGTRWVQRSAGTGQEKRIGRPRGSSEWTTTAIGGSPTRGGIDEN